MKRLICLVLVLLVVGWIAPVMAADQMGLGGIWIQRVTVDGVSMPSMTKTWDG